MTEIEHIYDLSPDAGGFMFLHDYTPMIRAIGDVLVTHDIGEYQGDTLVLYRGHVFGIYGYLCFGWGSCSGCDALQHCTTIEEAQSLLDELRAKVIWGTRDEIRDYLVNHDWRGDWMNKEDVQPFIAKALSAMGYVESEEGN